MTRWITIAGACVVASTMALSAQGRSGAPARGGNQGTPARGQGSTAQNPELQQAREALQKDVAEGKRLQQQLKSDKQAGDRDAIKRDTEALKTNREAVKRDQDRIKQLLSGRGRGRGTL